MASGESGDGSCGEPRTVGRGGANSQHRSAAPPKRRAGTKGKPGKALTLENLQAVFGLSLQARELNLFRACAASPKFLLILTAASVSSDCWQRNLLIRNRHCSPAEQSVACELDIRGTARCTKAVVLTRKPCEHPYQHNAKEPSQRVRCLLLFQSTVTRKVPAKSQGVHFAACLFLPLQSRDAVQRIIVLPMVSPRRRRRRRWASARRP